MLRNFGAKNGLEPHLTLHDSLRDNQLARAGTGRKNELDYILVRENGCPLRVERALRVFKRTGWDARKWGRSDLSYRYAVSAKVSFGDANTPPPS